MYTTIKIEGFMYRLWFLTGTYCAFSHTKMPLATFRFPMRIVPEYIHILPRYMVTHLRWALLEVVHTESVGQSPCRRRRDGCITPCVCGSLNTKTYNKTQLLNSNTSNILQHSFPFIFFALKK